MKITGLCMAVMLLAGAASAQTVYHYEDKNGTVVFTEDASQIPENQLQKAKDGAITLKNSAPVATPTPSPSNLIPKWFSREAKEEKKKAARPKITLYVASWCGYCRALKAHLDKKGFAYTEYDIEKDQAAGREFGQRFGGGGIPVMDIDGEIMRGYSPEAVDKILSRYQ